MIDFAAVWDRTRDAVEVPRPSVFERSSRAAGLPAAEARLVAVASAFRGVWLTGVVAVLGFAALAAAAGHARGEWLFLAVAPVVPCLVVAAGYDPWMDPALEPELVTPYPALRLVLLRTIAVLALALPAVLVFGLAVPGETAFAWLLPAVGFVAVVLAASTWVSPLRAAIAVSSAWLAVIWLLAARAGSPGRGAPGPGPPGGLPGAGGGLVRDLAAARRGCASFGRGGSDGDRFDLPARRHSDLRHHAGVIGVDLDLKHRARPDCRPQRRREDHAATPAGQALPPSRGRSGCWAWNCRGPLNSPVSAAGWLSAARSAFGEA